MLCSQIRCTTMFVTSQNYATVRRTHSVGTDALYLPRADSLILPAARSLTRLEFVVFSAAASFFLIRPGTNARTHLR